MFKIVEKDGEEYACLDPEYRKEIVIKKYNYLLQQSGIPKYYWNIEFEDYKGKNSLENVNKLKYYSTNFKHKKFNHVHLYLWGLNNSQKCITKDSIILTDSGFKYIDHYDNGLNDFSDLNINLITKDNLQQTSNFYKTQVNETVKIKTDLGFELEGTHEHPIYVYNKECNFQFKKLEDISIDDNVVILRRTNIFNKKKYEINFNYIKNKCDFNSKQIIIPKELNKNLARFLGYFIANGYAAYNYISLSSKNKKIQEDIQNILKEYNLSISKIYNGLDFKIHSIIFKEFIYYLCGILEESKFTARYKYVPKCILESPKEIQIEFLKGLIDCDSYYKKGRLGYFTASKKLSNEVQLMLLNLGIVSKKFNYYKKEYDHTYYELWMNGFDVNNYFDLISTSLKYSNICTKKDSCLNSIPNLLQETKKELKKLRQILKVNRGGFFLYENRKILFKLGRIIHFGNDKINLSRKKYLFILNLLKEFIIYDKDNILKNLICKYEDINNNYIFTKIILKENLTEKKDVFDFTVPKFHNFYSNGIISHNTALACNVGKEIIKQGYNCKFVLAGSLIDKLMKLQGYGTQEELELDIKKLKESDVLIIDDIFDSKKSIYWAKQDSSSLIITAWDSFLRDVVASNTKIVLTSNIPVNSIKNKFGESMFHLIDRNFLCLGFNDDVKPFRKENFDNLFPEGEKE